MATREPAKAGQKKTVGEKAHWQKQNAHFDE
jgi:hypothetical protein